MAPALPISPVQQVVDRVVASRYGSAVETVDRLRRQDPGADSAQLTRALIRRTQRELGAVAALSGGAAAVPGVGTAAVLATTGADAAWTLTRLAEMVMAIGVAHGHRAASFEERKAWVLATLAAANGATGAMDELAGRWGRAGGVKFLSRMGPSRLESLNTKVASRFATRLMTGQMAQRAGRMVPFGIGAGIGATGNVLVTRMVGRAATELFAVAEHGARRVDDDILDLDGEEIDPRDPTTW